MLVRRIGHRRIAVRPHARVSPRIPAATVTDLLRLTFPSSVVVFLMSHKLKPQGNQRFQGIGPCDRSKGLNRKGRGSAHGRHRRRSSAESPDDVATQAFQRALRAHTDPDDDLPRAARRAAAGG